MMSWWHDISFASKWAFWLLPIPIIMLIWFIWSYRRAYPELILSSTSAVQKLFSIRGLMKQLLPLLRILGVSLMIVALARPQTKSSEEKIKSEGISIVIALDISSSMLARDFKPDRISAAKEVAASFIKQRPNDRIGLVDFAGESFTQCPITADHDVLINQLMKVAPGDLDDGTAIGMGLGTAVNRLTKFPSKSKVIILLTDGVNNAGFVDPLTASEAAKQFGARVYTIGVGKKGRAYAPVAINPYSGEYVFDYVDVQIDEKLLQQISINTGGKYFRADNNDKLKSIFNEIDKMEKTKLEVSSFEHKTEQFQYFLWAAAVLILVEIFLRYTILRSNP
jgi:Ca-activated chloride channel family protein